ncbi:MAG: translation initiation factor IF-2, partial [Candidatus Cloacimonetes bacterium]|nr:translation initiation factor IF-2 [Candidatus Cloacimonadota bacterium]
DHAKAANVQLIVAINKVDLPEANVDRTINDLMSHGLYLENYGGDVLWCKTSAMTGEGINELLDTILLSSEIMELSAPLETYGRGIVIESQKDARKGVMVTVLLQEGRLKKGDNIVCGANYGRVRKLENEREIEIDNIESSDVAVIYGISGVPKAGDILNQVEDERTARQISSERLNIRKEREKYQAKTNLENLFQRIKEDKMSEVKLIVKGDTDGSVGALCDSFQKLSTEEVAVNIIRSSVGGINEADVNLASASDALIIGFHVRANNPAKKLAEDENVEIKVYQIIYEAIEDIQNAMSGLLEPEDREVYLGTAEILKVFKIKKLGQIAGVRVVKGKITNSGKVRIYRNDILIHEGNLSSLKHYSEEVKEVKAGSEGGIGVENYNDLKEGDVIENYIIEQVARTL